MALVPNRQAQMMRRITTWSLLGDVVVSGLIFLAISHVFGFLLFLIGLAVIGFFYYNVRQTFRNTGRPW